VPHRDVASLRTAPLLPHVKSSANGESLPHLKTSA
jgi:hypothetical protein